LYDGVLEPWAAALSVIAVLTIVIFLATLTYRWIEKPARSYLMQHPPRLLTAKVVRPA
jgi:peptidoglycan/LPS O-acetylase OafA/YrhL